MGPSGPAASPHCCFHAKQHSSSNRQGDSLHYPWVVARDESGPRYWRSPRYSGVFPFPCRVGCGLGVPRGYQGRGQSQAWDPVLDRLMTPKPALSRGLSSVWLYLPPWPRRRWTWDDASEDVACILSGRVDASSDCDAPATWFEGIYRMPGVTVERFRSLRSPPGCNRGAGSLGCTGCAGSPRNPTCRTELDRCGWTAEPWREPSPAPTSLSDRQHDQERDCCCGGSVGRGRAVGPGRATCRPAFL